VKGKKDLARMEEVDKFRNALVDRVVGTARTVFL